MPRTITIHPLSLGLGFVLASITFITMSQQIAPPANPWEHVQVSYGPHPREMVQIQTGAPYTVPVGKTFVLTALGTPTFYASPVLSSFIANGQPILTVLASPVLGPESRSMVPVPQGYSASAGTVLTVAVYGGSTSCSAWGYLARE